METYEILEKLQPWIQQRKRPAWKPRVKAGDKDLIDSKFAGMPWIAESESWPSCNTCHRPLQLFLQLNLAKLPQLLEGKFGQGLLQLFYCIGDADSTCDAYDIWEPFSETNKLVRIIQPVGEPLTTDALPLSQSFPAKTIVGWKEIVDYPNPQEHRELGLDYRYDFKNRTVSITCQALGLVIEDIRDEYLAENISTSEAGDKLGGWPLWIQNIEYPYCPICNERMELVFQIDSEDNLPYMFCDLGTGHITQCARHKEVVAFGWACS